METKNVDENFTRIKNADGKFYSTKMCDFIL